MDGALVQRHIVALGIRCAVVSYDYTVLAGTQGHRNHQKKDRLFELAERLRLPVVLFAEGGGGRPGDTDVPVVSGLDCLAFALDQGIVEGIYGGFDEDDRKGLRRRVTKGTTTITDAAKATPPEKKPSTLRAYFDANTTRIFGGHLEWTGPAKPAFRGRDYTPRRIAFVIDRGYEPTGQVLTDCGHKGCVLPAHLTDADERKAPKSEAAEEIRLPRWNREPEPCGTREAYQRHRRRGETPCEPCRAANSAAESRWSRGAAGQG